MYTWRHASNFIEDFIDDPIAAGKITGHPQRRQLRHVRPHRVTATATTSNGATRRCSSSAATTCNRSLYLERPLHAADSRTTATSRAKRRTSRPIPPTSATGREILTARSFPDGRLNDFQRSKIRLWAGLQPGPRTARASSRSDRSGATTRRQTYSLFATAVPLSAIQLAAQSGLRSAAGRRHADPVLR